MGATHGSKMSPKQWMIKVADAELAQGTMHKWDWGEGTLMYGLLRAWESTGEERYLEYAKQWLDYHIAKGFVVDHGDRCCPGIAALMMYELTDDEKYMIAAEQISKFLFEHAGETDGEAHMVWSRFWADDLFMTCPFLARMGNITGDGNYHEAAVSQIILYTKKLRDKSTGLFYHAWYPQDQSKSHLYRTWHPERGKTSPCFWGRGNGWIVMAVAEVLSILPENTSRREELKEILEAQLRPVARLQDKSGMWHTVLDREDTYLETSATAMITYGMAKAMKQGLVERKYWDNVKRGWDALTGKVSEEDRVTGVSGGTGPGNCEHYQGIAVGVITWGTGSFLLAASELIDGEA